jgi:hypothetical protein
MAYKLAAVRPVLQAPEFSSVLYFSSAYNKTSYSKSVKAPVTKQSEMNSSP